MRLYASNPALRPARQTRWAQAAGSQSHRCSRLVTAAAAHVSRTERLRSLLQQPSILKGPCCHDALSARLIERAGFSYAFMSGFCTAGARLGAPDTGLISYAEMVDQGRYIMEATRHIPVIGDGDTGYGNAMNVKRTVRGYAQAGFAGILIEDQVAPKSCGHVRGKRVVSREEAISRIRAAADARDEGADILIVARTDARQAASFEEALWRAQAFADAGADILFIDALESVQEMKVFCALGGRAASLPKMANMLEGGGKTPLLSPEELERLGFKLVAYPLSLLGVSIKAMETALDGLKDGRLPSSQQLGSFEDIQSAVGFPEYYEEEARYALSTPWVASPAGGPTSHGGVDAATAAANAATKAADTAPPPSSSSSSGSGASVASGFAGVSGVSGWSGGSVESSAGGSSSASGASSSSSGASGAVEADAVIEDAGTAVTVVSRGSRDGGSDGSRSDADNRRAQFLRVRISDVATGLVKLETRIPAGFLSGLTALVPSVSGFNLEVMVNRALNKESRDPGDPLFATTQGPDRIEIYLE